MSNVLTLILFGCGSVTLLAGLLGIGWLVRRDRGGQESSTAPSPVTSETREQYDKRYKEYLKTRRPGEPFAPYLPPDQPSGFLTWRGNVPPDNVPDGLGWGTEDDAPVIPEDIFPDWYGKGYYNREDKEE